MKNHLCSVGVENNIVFCKAIYGSDYAPREIYGLPRRITEPSIQNLTIKVGVKMKYDILTEINRDIPEQYDGVEGFMFTAYGCAVFETELEDGRFENSAINLTSGTKQILEHRKNQITNVTIERLVTKLHNSKIAGLGRLEVSNKETITLTKLKTVLHELFHYFLPIYGYTIHKEHIIFAEQLLNSIIERKMMVVETAAGPDKIFVYVIVGALVKRSGINLTWCGSCYSNISAVEWKRIPVIISTSSSEAQKYITDCIKKISTILDESGVIKTPLCVVVKKENRNYICKNRLIMRFHTEQNHIIKEQLYRILINKIFDFDDAEKISKHIRTIICVPKKCDTICHFAYNCGYIQNRENADKEEVDIIITNHRLFLLDAKLRAEGKRGLIAPAQLHIIDDATKLLSTARYIYKTELSYKSLNCISKQLLALNITPSHNSKKSDWKDTRDAVRNITNQLALLNDALFSHPKPISETKKLLRSIHATINYLLKVLGNGVILKYQRDERQKNILLSELDKLVETVKILAFNEDIHIWFKPNDSTAFSNSLYGLPKRLDDRLHNDLWKRGIPALVLMENTLFQCNRNISL
jgi:hypothetical protein